MSLNKYIQKGKNKKSGKSPQITKPPAKDYTNSVNSHSQNKNIILFNKLWKIIAGIIIIVTFLITLYNFFKPNDNIKKGYINSPKLSSNSITTLKDHPSFIFNTEGYQYPIIQGIHIDSLSKMNKKEYVSILLGGYVVLSQIGSLYQGIEILNPNYGDCSNSFLAIVAKDDRLYVWTKFIDLRTQDVIGEMALNHWCSR